MEIAFIHPSHPGSEGTGATHTATQVVTGLAERGHAVTVYCTAPPQDETEVADGITLERIETDGFPYHTNSKLNRELRDRADEFDQYDVTNSYVAPALPAMEYIGRNTSTATGVTLNAYGAVCPKNDLLYMDEEQCDERSLARCGRCIAATSPGHDEFSAPYRMVSKLGNLRLVRQGARDLDAIDFFRAPSGHVKENYVEFGFPEDRIHVIPHPLNDDFLVEHQSDFSEPYRLLYVGYLEKQKGVEKLIPILSEVRERLDVEVTLTIVGDGGLRSDMERQACEYDVWGAADFKGFIPNKQLPKIYSNHDIFVYPGIWEEPLARVYLEALATGTPIVSSYYGSVESIIGGGGKTITGSISEWADAIQNLICENHLGMLSKNAKQKSDEYRIGSILPNIEGMYKV